MKIQVSTDGGVTTRRDGSSGYISSSIVHRQPIVIEGQDEFNVAAFLANGKHVITGDDEGKIRHWRVEDGTEVETPIVAESGVLSVAVSRDGRWIVGGTKNGFVTVWNTETHDKAIEFKGHSDWVRAIDISLDSKKITTGSDDRTVCVWSLSTGERLLGPWKHSDNVGAAKFSPDGCLIATAAWSLSVSLYDTQQDRLIVNVPRISVGYSAFNACLAWASDGKRLFALSGDGNISCLEVLTWATLSQWRIHSATDVQCIALTYDDRFIAAAADGKISLWNTATHEQIGSIIRLAHPVWSMAISADCDLVACGKKRVSLCNLRSVLSSHLVDENDSLRAQVETLSSRVVYLENTVEELRTQLIESQHAAREQEEAITLWQTMSGHLERTIENLHSELAKIQHTTGEQQKTIRSLRSDLHTQETTSNDKITLLEQIVRENHAELAESQQNAARFARINHVYERVHQCESLYVKDRIHDAAELLLQMMSITPKDMMVANTIGDWILEFTNRCSKKLEVIGDEASYAGRRDEAVAAYSIILSIGYSIPSAMLKKWANTILSGGSVQETLRAARKFKHSMFAIYRIICETLEENDRLMEAVECFRRMRNEVLDDAATHDIRVQWEQEFQKRCVERSEKLGDAARDSGKHGQAIGYYSELLLLEPTNLDILLKQSNEIIKMDPSSHKGYEAKHAALHGMGRYREAFEAFRKVVLAVEQSPDSNIRRLRSQYIDATSAIQKEVDDAIRDMPTVLIDTETGRLYDKIQQGEAFKELQVYEELRSSMTTRLDVSRIRAEVKNFYRYVMFSHRWQPHEPTFQQVQNTPVYKLPLSPTFSKLQNFCKLVYSLRFKWAWTDTCCVNQLDKGAQQESVVAMFRWYRGSALTIVHLLGVLSASPEIGRLRRSIWNERGWTYQEYVASKVVQFYTEDWKPYLELAIFNHKESSDILSEMEEAMNFASTQLITIQPGLDMAREKLYLASMRQTTREEDIAYSLFGVFNVALPVIYGEGLQAVGRFLEHILTRSGDVTLLAWTGVSGSHHSYLPVNLTVYNQLVAPHIPSPLEPAETDAMTAALNLSSIDISMAISLYNRLHDLPSLSLVSGRLKLPGIVFPLDDLVLHSGSNSESNVSVYRAITPILGDVEISTGVDLCGMGRLTLIHPWISLLLDQDFSHGEPQFDLATRAMRLIVRLRQPFGALLLAPWARAQYRRAATDSLIMVQIHKDVSLTDLMDSIRVVDIQ